MNTPSFDDKALTWDDDPAKVERANRVADAIRAELALDTSVRMLEYGAGTGLVTQALRDAVGPVTLADTSKGMRQVMEDKIQTGVLADARVWNLDLASGPPPAEEFDLIVTVMALHHIPRLGSVLSGFSNMLVTGGHLCISDLEEEDGSFHADDFEGHHGFARSALTSQLVEAGFVDISFQACHQVVRDTGTYPLFLCISTSGNGASIRPGV